VRHGLAAAVLLIAASAAGAQEKPRFCPNRPDLGASGCVTAPGEVQAELSGVDWQRDDTADAREDSISYGDMLARFGVGPRTEVQVQWTPYATVRTRDKASGAVSRVSGVGDVRLAVRQNLSGPDGEGLSAAIEPFAVLPTGRSGVGDGDWSAGLVVPVAYDLGHDWGAGVTAEASAQADEDGHGRHANVNAAFGLGRELGGGFSATAELYLEQDDDPDGARTQAAVAGSAAWQPSDTTQIDVLAVAGLNRDTPDVRVVLGGAWLFGRGTGANRQLVGRHATGR
jgi:hypothetical protein